MIQLFPRDPACEWCGDAHPVLQLCHARPGLTRRSFLFLSAATIVLAATIPAALVEPHETYDVLDSAGFDCAQFNAILKEVYAPLIIADLNRPSSPILQLMSEGRPRGGQIRVPVRVGQNFAVGLR